MRTCSCLAFVALLTCILGVSACAISIPEAKLLPDGSGPITIESRAVTHAETDLLYIEEDPQTCGIRVELPGHGIAVGAKVNVTGTVQTNGDKERYIAATEVVAVDSGDVGPVGMRCGALGGGDWHYDSLDGRGQKGVTGGVGLNTIGLLVTAWGAYTKTGADTFTIDDGSGQSINCVAVGGLAPGTTWDYVSVVGACSMSYDPGSGAYTPLLRVSSVNVVLQEVISKPGTPYGESDPIVGVEYLYSTTGATSNYGHELEYRVDFGDGTQSDWSMFRGARHTYAQTGPKTITITARCKLHPDVSATSDPLVVNVVDGLGWVHCAPTRLYATPVVLAVDQWGNVFSGNDHGVYRSTDHGENWLQMGIFNAQRIAIDSRGWLYTTTGTSSASYGILRSKDNGDHWDYVNNGLPNLVVPHIHADSAGVVYAIGSSASGYAEYRSVDGGESWQVIPGAGFTSNTKGFTEDTHGNVYFGDSASVFRSSDRGLTWTKVGAGLSGTVRALAASPNGDIFSANSSSGLYRSSDHGDSWASLGLASEWPQCVAVDSAGRVFVTCYTTKNTYRSTDNGATWQQLPAASGGQPAIGPDNTVYLPGSSSILRSSDNGDTWATVGYGIDESEGTSVCIDQLDRVLVGGNGIYRTADQGNSWTQLKSGSANFLSVNQTGAIYSSWYFTLNRSVDQGATWTQIWRVTDCYPGPTLATANGSLVTHVMRQIYSTEWSWRIMRSTDGGDTWNWVTDEVGMDYAPGHFLLLPSGWVYHFALDNVIRSADNGATWTQAGTLPNTALRGAACDSFGYLYCLTYYWPTPQIYRSTNGGASWTLLADVPSWWNCIGINSLDHIFVFGLRGQYSTDGGASWHEASDGLPGGFPTGEVNAIAFDSQGYAYVVTQGNGVYRSSRSTTQ